MARMLYLRSHDEATFRTNNVIPQHAREVYLVMQGGAPSECDSAIPLMTRIVDL